MKSNKLYISILKNDFLIGVICFHDKKAMTSSVFDLFYDNGYIIKEISKEEYDDYSEGDELAIEDIINDNFKIE